MEIDISRALSGFPPGFHEDDKQRSAFVRRLILEERAAESAASPGSSEIPKVVVRFWHDAEAIPTDVKECLDSWEQLREPGSNC